MKKLMITLGAIAAAAATYTAQAEEAPAQAETAKPETAEAAELEKEESPLVEFSLALEVNSAYVSHNRIFSDTPVAQYDVWTQLNLPENFGWFAFDVWASQELNKRHSSHSSPRANNGKRLGGLGEIDYEIVYGNSIGPVNLTASHLWYTYPRCGYASQKFWTLGAEYDNEFVVPSVKFFWEYAHNNKPDEAFMIDFALSKGFEITEDLSLTFTSKAPLYTSEYAKYISTDDNGVSHLTDTVFGGWDNGISLSYALTDNVSLGAHLNYLYKIDHRVRHCEGWDTYSVGTGHGNHDGLVYGGASASVSF